MILPTRLDFDASRAPKNCNVKSDFKGILSEWVPNTVWRDDTERRLVVRIHQTSRGGKRADVSLVDAQGATFAEWHQDFAAKVECHKVLWEVARDAAKLMGAFEPPPPKEPAVFPECSAHPDYPRAAPILPAPLCPPLPSPTTTLFPASHNSFIGLGASVGSGIYSKLNAGPYLLLGWVPSRRWAHVHVEFEGAWTSQTLQSIRTHSIPLVGSLCWVTGTLRFCGGLATMIFVSNQSPSQEELRLMFGGSFRMGTELFVHGSLSIRADVFGRIAFAERGYGNATAAFDDPMPLAAGSAVLWVWKFD